MVRLRPCCLAERRAVSTRAQVFWKVSLGKASVTPQLVRVLPVLSGGLRCATTTGYQAGLRLALELETLHFVLAR